MRSLALWVYGVLDGAVPGPPPCPGVDRHHGIELVRAGGLAAIASRVPSARFDAPALCRSLAQPRTVEALVRAHENVLREALALGPVVPFGFATVFETLAGVRTMLARDRASLFASLGQLRGKAEWALKAYADEPPDGSLVDELHQRLAATAILATRLTTSEPDVALNAAYLVADSDAPVFAALVWKLAREHDRDGIALELSGPWPAFHFSEAAAA
jgi:gas vesicle protein GvpL/GvpF